MGNPLLELAEFLYEAVPDRKSVRFRIHTRIWNPDEADIDEALDIIESKVQLGKDQTITFNGHRGRWIINDFDRLEFVDEKDLDRDTEPSVHDPTTLDRDMIWHYVKRDLDPKDITEELKATLVEEELVKRRNLALFLYYAGKLSQDAGDDIPKKLKLQYRELLDVFEIHDAPKSYVGPATGSADKADMKRFQQIRHKIMQALDSKQVITKERLQQILSGLSSCEAL